MSKEVHSFQIAKNMIFHTIESQAGSIEKAILECLMNAVDAKATKVSVEIKDDGTHYIIEDNGHGFRTKDEIKECFGVFGFDHGTDEENDRTYGTFGIGRAQLWAFSKNIWHTNEFILDVDIKNKGLDYSLTKSKKSYQGCKIEGEFYERLNAMEIQNTVRALKKLALYLPIEFKLNGKVVNKDSTKEKWDIETDDAYLKLNDTGDLNVYNLGVFVCSYPNYRFGKGGVINSKQQLKLNTARNDILISKCTVWKRLKKYLEDEAKKQNLNRKTMTDDMRKNLIMQWIAGDVSYLEFEDRKVIPDIKGRLHAIKSINKFNNKFTVCPVMGSQTGENIHENKICFVMAPKVLDWFSVDNAEELIDVMSKALERDCQGLNRYANPFVNRTPKVQNYDDLSRLHSSTYNIIPPSKYTRKQKAFSKILDNINSFAHKMVCSHERLDWTQDIRRELPYRKPVIGKSKQARGWTDAQTYIAVEADSLQRMIETDGVDGLINLHYLFIHEYLHKNSSNQEHVHSHEFYESFHDIIMKGGYHRIYQNTLNVMDKLFKTYNELDLSIPPSLGKVEARLIKQQEKADKLSEKETEVA